MMREIEAQESEHVFQAGNDIPMVSMVLRSDRQSDQRRYNYSPTSNEVTMVFVNENGEPPFERDIRIYPKNPEDPQNNFVNLHILSSNLDPMTYALLYPYTANLDGKQTGSAMHTWGHSSIEFEQTSACSNIKQHRQQSETIQSHYERWKADSAVVGGFISASRGKQPTTLLYFNVRLLSHEEK